MQSQLKDKVNKINCFQSGPQFRRLLSRQTRIERLSAVGEAVKIVDRSIQTVHTHRFKYILYCVIIVILLVRTRTQKFFSTLKLQTY
jgi:hypothetical protein